MASVGEWVVLCAAGDRAGWERFWAVAGDAAEAPIQRVVAAARLDRGLAEDLAQEFFVYLRTDGSGRLRSFRGGSEGQLRRYVGLVADRFARTRLARRRRALAREAQALRERARDEVDRGLSEERVLAALAELEALLDAAGRARLRTELDPAAPDVPDRTRRRWAGRLARLVSIRTGVDPPG